VAAEAASSAAALTVAGCYHPLEPRLEEKQRASAAAEQSVDTGGFISDDSAEAREDTCSKKEL
jgi:hypothetical protein